MFMHGNLCLYTCTYSYIYGRSARPARHTLRRACFVGTTILSRRRLSLAVFLHKPCCRTALCTNAVVGGKCRRGRGGVATQHAEFSPASLGIIHPCFPSHRWEGRLARSERPCGGEPLRLLARPKVGARTALIGSAGPMTCVAGPDWLSTVQDRRAWRAGTTAFVRAAAADAMRSPTTSPEAPGALSLAAPLSASPLALVAGVVSDRTLNA